MSAEPQGRPDKPLPRPLSAALQAREEAFAAKRRYHNGDGTLDEFKAACERWADAIEASGLLRRPRISYLMRIV